MSAINDTIIALATPVGVGALGVLRISGPRAIELANDVFVSPKKSKSLTNQKGQTLHFGTIVDGEHILDEVLLSLFRNPNSYTGEDLIEISCHGSPYILKEVVQLFIRQGARHAKPGEFTMRAFANGKLDLSQAEAVADLIASENEAMHQVAMQQMRGGFSAEISELRNELINFASLLELELDFAEEDVEFADRTALVNLLKKIEKTLTRLIESFSIGNVIKNGIPVAIVGAPNAGKSTLLNALLNEERAIVSEIAGTTRDVIEDEIHLNGLTFRFIDTAGIRETQDVVESIGIQRAFEKINQAHVIIHIFDAGEIDDNFLEQRREIQEKAKGKPVLLVANKMDKTNAKTVQTLLGENAFVPLIAKTKEGLEDVQNALISTVETNALSNNAVIVTNARHYEALVRSNDYARAIQNGLQGGLSSEFIAQDIRKALFHLGEITGEITTDDLLGNIFSKFCIGK